MRVMLKNKSRKVLLNQLCDVSWKPSDLVPGAQDAINDQEQNPTSEHLSKVRSPSYALG